MAATENDVTLVPNTATLLTTSDCTAIRAQILSDALVRFKATATTTAPASFTGGINLFSKGDTIPGNQTLAELFPGVTGAVRVWAYSDQAVAISFSHD